MLEALPRVLQLDEAARGYLFDGRRDVPGVDRLGRALHCAMSDAGD